MATLKAMFRLFDGYSSTIDKINRKTDQATGKILKASGITDKFNTKLKATGASANSASNGLSKFISIAALVGGSIKGMSIADEYTNTNARLGLITNSLKEQAELQEKIFAAANRSKGSYTSMAAAISKMGITASEAFGSNDELVAFTELIQKGFKVGGASTTEQSSAMLQLTQAMGAGKLQGDEFRSIMENAPMIAQAIAKYTGKSKGELKEMSADGVITSDIIKNAMFMASDDINKKFKTMPMTFADVWNKIKNGATKAFRGVITKINNLLNTADFANFVNGLIVGFNLVAQAASWLIDAIASIASVFSDNWSWISPIIWGIVAALVAYSTVAMITNAIMGIQAGLAAGAAAAKMLESGATFSATVAQYGLNAALYACPITWIIIAIIALVAIFYAAVAAVNHFAGTSVSATGIIAGAFMTALAFIGNLFITAYNLLLDGGVILWNFFAAFAEFFANVFNDPIGSIVRLFAGMADSILEILEGISSAIDTMFGSNLAGAVSGWRSNLQGMVTDLVGEAKIKVPRLDASTFHLERFEYGDAYDSGYKFGQGVDKKVSSLADLLTGGNKDTGTSNDPIAVKGLGNGGKVEVDMDDEDLQYLRDIAERDYINKFSTATLAPNIQVSFGDVHETADANKVAGRIKKILQEEIAMTAEGAYS